MSDTWQVPRGAPRSARNSGRNPSPFGSFSARGPPGPEDGFQMPRPPQPQLSLTPPNAGAYSMQQQQQQPGFTPPYDKRMTRLAAAQSQSVFALPRSNPGDLMKTPRSMSSMTTPRSVTSSTMPILPGISEGVFADPHESFSPLLQASVDSPSTTNPNSSTPPFADLQSPQFGGPYSARTVSTYGNVQGFMGTMSMRNLEQHYDSPSPQQHHMHHHHHHQRQHGHHRHHNHHMEQSPHQEDIQRHRSLSSAPSVAPVSVSGMEGMFGFQQSQTAIPTREQEMDHLYLPPAQQSHGLLAPNPDVIYRLSQPWNVRSSSAGVALNHLITEHSENSRISTEEGLQNEGTRRRLQKTTRKSRPFVISLLAFDQVKLKIMQREPGDNVLWVDPISATEISSAMNSKKSHTRHSPDRINVKKKLSLALKLKTAVWCAPLPYEVRVSSSVNGEDQSCSIAPKQYEPVRYTLEPFLPVVKQLVTAATDDRNYVETDFALEKDIMDELQYRKYLVFPCCCKGKSQFCLCKQTSDKHSLHRLSIVINWESGIIVCETKRVKKYPAFSSFKETLRDFLSDEWPDFLCSPEDTFSDQSIEPSPAGSKSSKRIDSAPIQVRDAKTADDYQKVVLFLLSLFSSSSLKNLAGADVRLLESALKTLRNFPHVISPLLKDGFLEGVVNACCRLKNMQQSITFEMCQFFIRVCGSTAMELASRIMLHHLLNHSECPCVMQLFADVSSIPGFTLGDKTLRAEFFVYELHTKVLNYVFPDASIFPSDQSLKLSPQRQSAQRAQRGLMPPPQIKERQGRKSGERLSDDEHDSEFVPIKRSTSGHLSVARMPAIHSISAGSLTSRNNSNISPRTRLRLGSNDAVVIPSLTLPVSSGKPATVVADEKLLEQHLPLPPSLERIASLCAWHVAAADVGFMLKYVFSSLPFLDQLTSIKPDTISPTSARESPGTLLGSPLSPQSPVQVPLLRASLTPHLSDDEKKTEQTHVVSLVFSGSNSLRVHYHTCFLRVVKNILQRGKRLRLPSFSSDAILAYHDPEHLKNSDFMMALWETLTLDAQRLDAAYRLEWNVLTDGMSLREINILRSTNEVFTHFISSRIRSARVREDLKELSIVTHLLHDYTKHCRTPSLAIHLIRYSGKELLDSLTWLTKTRIDSAERLESLKWTLRTLHLFAKQGHMWPYIYAFYVHVSFGAVFESIKALTLEFFIDDRRGTDSLLNRMTEEQVFEYRMGLLTHYTGVVNTIEYLTDKRIRPAKKRSSHRPSKTIVELHEKVEEKLKNGMVNLSFLYNPHNGLLMEFLNSRRPRRRDADQLLQSIDLVLLKCFSSPYLPYRGDIQEMAPFYCKYYSLFSKLFCTPDSISSLKCSDVALHVLQGFARVYSSDFVTDSVKMKMVELLTLSVSLEYSIKFEWTRYLPNEQNLPFFPEQARLVFESRGDVPAPAAKDQKEPTEVAAVRTVKNPKAPIHPMNIPKLRLGGSSPSLGVKSIPQNRSTSPPVKTPGSRRRRSKQDQSSHQEPTEEGTKKEQTSSQLQLQSMPQLTGEPESMDEMKGKEDQNGEKKEEETIAPKTHEKNEEGKEEGGGEKVEEKKEEKKEGSKQLPKSKKDGKEKKKKKSKKEKKPSIPKLKLACNIPSLPGTSADTLHLPSSAAVEKNSSEDSSSSALGSPSSEAATSFRNSGLGRNGLTQLEKKLMLDPKFQVHQRDKPELFVEPLDAQSEAAKELERLYRRLRGMRATYLYQDLHVSIITTLMCLLLTESGALDETLSDQFPLENRKMNILFILHYHLNHHANEEILPALFNSAQKMGQKTLRLLFMLCEKFFYPKLYSKKTKLTEGGFGVIYRADVTNMDQRIDLDCPGLRVPKRRVVIKDIPVPKGIFDRCVLHDNFNEIVALERCRDDPRVAHLYTYGVYDDHYWIVMKSYKTSLRKWRKAQTRPLSEMLPLYLNVYSQLLSACHALQEHKINHFDLKLDNILIDPLSPEISDEEFWNPTSPIPVFYPCLADFGEALVYTDEEQYTTRNRGTEYCKSPEMLKIAYASQKERDFYDRRKKAGCSSASDVWAIAIMLYELLTGEYLFYDDDWVRFFMRVTEAQFPLLTPQNKEALLHNQHLITFFEKVLVRDPIRRPTIRELTSLFELCKRRVFMDLGLPPPPKLSDLVCQPVRERGRTGEYIGGASSWVPRQLDVPQEYIDEIKHLNVSDDFLEEPTELRPSLFLGARQCLRSADKLVWDYRITHIVNITGKPINNSSQYFQTLEIDPATLTVPSFDHWIDGVIGFYRSAIIRNGKVLIISETSMSTAPAFAIAIIMETRMLSYYEAFVYVKERRYFIDPHPRLVEVLLHRALLLSNQWNIRYYEPSWKLQPRCHLRCFCGACCISLFQPLPKSSLRHCHCSSENSAVTDNSSCPYSGIGCDKLLEFGNNRYGTQFSDVPWLNATQDDLVCPVSSWDSFGYVSQRPPDSTWVFYECRICRTIIGGYDTASKNVMLLASFDCSDCLLDKLPLIYTPDGIFLN